MEMTPLSTGDVEAPVASSPYQEHPPSLDGNSYSQYQAAANAPVQPIYVRVMTGLGGYRQSSAMAQYQGSSPNQYSPANDTDSTSQASANAQFQASQSGSTSDNEYGSGSASSSESSSDSEEFGEPHFAPSQPPRKKQRTPLGETSITAPEVDQYETHPAMRSLARGLDTLRNDQNTLQRQHEELQQRYEDLHVDAGRQREEIQAEFQGMKRKHKGMEEVVASPNEIARKAASDAADTKYRVNEMARANPDLLILPEIDFSVVGQYYPIHTTLLRYIFQKRIKTMDGQDVPTDCVLWTNATHWFRTHTELFPRSNPPMIKTENLAGKDRWVLNSAGLEYLFSHVADVKVTVAPTTRSKTAAKTAVKTLTLKKRTFVGA
ncbi:hypothetical protein HK097_006297 [Rhizophlyctis rosea]|uniref:Uncharacterized protein n=1 Tax=Rhizophlyctis rosea TaxID=64517 RepID=A0AAD5X2V7_9FUNG|nr:hypothetical protein HK097_006297 [Rhizophlyctis rosea]